MENHPGMQDLKNDFVFILDHYLNAKKSKSLLFRRHIQERFKDLQLKIENLPKVEISRNIICDFGIGIGKMANVPWIALLDQRITQTIQEGVYCVFLFRADMSGFFLALIQGIGISGTNVPTEERLIELEENSKRLRQKVFSLREKGFAVDNEIDLCHPGITGEAYERSTIAYKYYDRDNLPDDTKISDDLSNVLEAYEQYINCIPTLRTQSYPSPYTPRIRESNKQSEFIEKETNGHFWADASFEILNKENRPLGPTELLQKILKKNVLSSTTTYPSTVYGAIMQEIRIKGPRSRFTKYGTKFGLIEWVERYSNEGHQITFQAATQAEYWRHFKNKDIPKEKLLTLLNDQIQEIRMFLNGDITDNSIQEKLCFWVWFCYQFGLYTEGALVFRKIDPSLVSPPIFNTIKKLGLLCENRR